MEPVQLANITAIERFARKHRDAAAWLANWIEIVVDATWRSLRDVRQQFPSADGVPLKSGVVVTVFNVKGNEYRLLTIISYASQRITVYDVLTHAEYNKEKWK
jgi:mRNA interferase HigB